MLQAQMEKKIRVALEPVEHLEIVNESYKHNVPEGAESHFKVLVVSPNFEGKAPIMRHRMVNSALKEELDMEGGIHALSIKAQTVAQFEKAGGAAAGVIQETPDRLGGSKA
jgi:BolA protein